MPSKPPSAPSPSDSRLLAALSYLWIVSVPIYLLKRHEPFVHFHSRQGLVLFVTSVVLMFIPMIGWVLNVVIVFLMIIAFFRALAGEEWKIPFISAIAEKF